MAISALIALAAKVAITAGAVSGGVGAKKMYDSKQSIDSSRYRYNIGKDAYEEKQNKMNKNLENLGKTKVRVWKDFDRFVIAFEKIKNKPEFIYQNEEKIKIKEINISEIKGVSITATEIIGTAILTGGAGAALGMATSTAVTAFGVASTGAAISGLSGAAATNATLAWLGGGAIAAGGGGMAAGTTLLGAIAAAPAAAIGGVFLNSKGNESKENAFEIKEEVNKALEQFKKINIYIDEIASIAKCINVELIKLNRIYIREIEKLENIVSINDDYNNFTIEEKLILDNNIKIVSLLKNLTDTELVIKTDENELGVVNNEEVESKIEISTDFRKLLI